MLCHLCETFLSNIIDQDITNWRRIKDVDEKWFTFKLGNHATVTAAALSGCELCGLFNRVRSDCILNYEGLGEKWHSQPASIDVKHRYDGDGDASKWTFQLLTVAPEMSWIPFEIFKPDVEERTDIDTSEWPLEVCGSPKSSRTISMAKQWLHDCLNDHPMCARPDLTPLPTRVIDVGASTEPSNPRLYISHREYGRYVTLSHCWGTGERTTLTKSNLHDFEQRIILDRLPKTFQDAIQLTRLLGVRYLWVDALCIIQNDQNDWKRESASMCSVFENAVFSISALAATDSHSGMLHTRTLPQIKTEINGIHVGVRQKLDALQEAMTRSRLETRAWCYQERLLPRGILHVAPHQLYWQCRTCTVSETAPNDQRPSTPTINAQENPSSHVPRLTSYATDWLRLVSVYSARQVTRASDRLPAISGLADKAKKEVLDSVYLQGLWSHDLHAGLLWKRQLVAHGKLIPSRDKYLARSSTSSRERPKRPIARSWSWASTNDAVEFLTTTLYPERSATKFDATFLIPDQRDDGGAGDLPNLVLQLEASVKRGICRLSSQSTSKPDEASFKPSGSLLVDDGLKCFLDWVDEPISKTCYCARIANWTKPSVKSKKRQDDDSEKAFYLLLERIQQSSADSAAEGDTFGTFRRIGIGFDIIGKVDKIFANAERRGLRLV